MKWIKKSFIFNASNLLPWAVKGAMIPTPYLLNDSVVRVFVTFLDPLGIGRTGYVDLSINDLSIVLAVSELPVFDIGKPGTFDESGVLTCSVVKNDQDQLLFYYAGFELGTQIRYRLLTGLATTDRSLHLQEKYMTPILERSEEELFFRGGPFVIFEAGVYRMWYVGGSNWTVIDGKSMPVYEVKYMESEDGISWPKSGRTCIAITNEHEHGFGRPWVIKHCGIYKMFYSIRVKQTGYRLGYAESNDGIFWVRKDGIMNELEVSNSGWDSEMICYSSVIDLNGKLVMFYNGNNFGASGFGYAELED